MKKIVIASNNKGKISEIQAMFPKKLEIELIPQSQFNIFEVEETASTFIENALIKARHAAQFTELPVMADDSGLVIDALNGAPGVLSARYAGKEATDKNRIQKVLDELKNSPESKRTARFHCVIVLLHYKNDPVPLIAQGVWEGSILFEPKGQFGFGYDPLFYVPTHHSSAAELSFAEKNRISHRAQALNKLMEMLSANS